MVPIKKIEDLISKHALLEAELSSGQVDKKLFAEKSKEYSDLNEIIKEAKEYQSFEKEKIDKKIIIICGPGSNGGDGIAAFHYLKKYNILSKLLFVDKLHGQDDLIKRYNLAKNDYSFYTEKMSFDKYDWIIDSIFGISKDDIGSIMGITYGDIDKINDID